jgi:hypothetical protein
VLVRLVSLENCPTGFAEDITRAANTQNRIERRDFAALDPNQKRLRTELYLENQKEYVYQTGEQPPQADAGCTLDETSVALACEALDIALCVQAKREVGMLYEDITKAPYAVIFNKGTTARALWRAVMVLRIVEAALKSEQKTRTHKQRCQYRYCSRLRVSCEALTKYCDAIVKVPEVLWSRPKRVCNGLVDIGQSAKLT